jgi:hypothetical protein
MVPDCRRAERSVHNKGPHGYGSLVRTIGGVSLHHNLWAHNRGRNPRLGDNYKQPPYPIFDTQQLVDLRVDRAEMSNLALESAYRGRRQELYDERCRWHAEVRRAVPAA